MDESDLLCGSLLLIPSRKRTGSCSCRSMDRSITRFCFTIVGSIDGFQILIISNCLQTIFGSFQSAFESFWERAKPICSVWDCFRCVLLFFRVTVVVIVVVVIVAWSSSPLSSSLSKKKDSRLLPKIRMGMPRSAGSVSAMTWRKATTRCLTT